jgi:hypothetical protein
MIFLPVSLPLRFADARASGQVFGAPFAAQLRTLPRFATNVLKPDALVSAVSLQENCPSVDQNCSSINDESRSCQASGLTPGYCNLTTLSTCSYYPYNYENGTCLLVGASFLPENVYGTPCDPSSSARLRRFDLSIDIDVSMVRD